MSNAYYRDLQRFPSWKGMAFHHFHYDHLRHRRSYVWVDGMYLPRWLHIQVIHRILGGGERVRDQRFGNFPNCAQRTVHWMCRLFMPIYYLTK